MKQIRRTHISLETKEILVIRSAGRSSLNRCPQCEAPIQTVMPEKTADTGAAATRTTMKINRRFVLFETLLLAVVLVSTSAAQHLRADTGSCGGQTSTLPFTDVQGNQFFCAIALAYFSGLTNGTSATTYSPSNPVPREQMAAFVGRTLDQSLRRGSRRAALGQWWTSRNPAAQPRTTVGDNPQFLVSDGTDVWVSNTDSNSISRVRASDGALLNAVSVSINQPQGIIVAAGSKWVAGPNPFNSNDGLLTRFDSLSAAGYVLPGATNPIGITFDGENIWTANYSDGITGGSLTRFNISAQTATIFTASYNFSPPLGILYDGANLWVTVPSLNVVRRVNQANGSSLQNIPVGQFPKFPAFDGANLWVPNSNEQSVTVVRAVGQLQGTVLATLTNNGLNLPQQVAFDGERVLVTNNGSDSVSLWKATDLTPLGTFSFGLNTFPFGICSDGTKFWVSLLGLDQIVSF
jgi:outer membrane lipoprotein-sorting protein